jgi:hypothetical protein
MKLIKSGRNLEDFVGFYFYFIVWADMWVMNFTLFFLTLSRLKFQTWISHGGAFHCGVSFKLFVYFLNKIQNHGWMLVCNIFIKKEVILEIGRLDADSACTCRKRNKKMLENSD